MVYYRKKKQTTKRPYKSRKYAKKATGTKKMYQIAKRVLNKNVETKTTTQVFTDGTEIFHNNYVTLTDKPFYTTIGAEDPSVGNSTNRIGDRISLRGVSLKMMVELNERYTDVTFRLMIVKAARGDTPTRSNLFVGKSGNKMLDSFNNERFTMIFQKWFKLLARNTGTLGVVGHGGAGSGIAAHTDTEQTIGRATRIIKVWLPYYKITKSGTITYDNGGTSPKFFDYHILLYAYSNYSTSQDVFYVARVNDFICETYYKDA